MSSEPESLILHMLREMRGEIGDMREQMSTKDDLRTLRADVAADLVALEARLAKEQKETREQIVGLRHTVIEYPPVSSDTGF